MTKLTLLGAAAILATALATPAMSQEATQEPGMIGFTYPNSNYLRGGYGVRTPSRHWLEARALHVKSPHGSSASSNVSRGRCHG